MKLLDYIPTVNPTYVRPLHLGRLCEALDKVGTVPQRRIFWHGPRCGLTETLIACMRLRGELTFAYGAGKRFLTDLRCGKGIFPAYGAGHRVSGAVFLDRFIPDQGQLDYLLTRLDPTASFFIFANKHTFGESPWAEVRKRALDLGFLAGWV